MEVGLKQKLYELIKLERYTTIERLRQYGEQMRYIDSNVERRLRELRNDGLIERVLNSVGVVIAYELKEEKKPFKTMGTTVDELKLEAEKALKNLKFGDSKQVAVLKMMKTLKQVRTDKDKKRILTNIIYNLQ